MAVILSRFIVKTSLVEVTITGTGDTPGCYATINQTTYTSEITGIEVMPGDVIIFGIGGILTQPGTLEIDGDVVLSVGDSQYGTYETYEWVVPDRITSVSIKLFSDPYFGTGSITVTTV